MHSFVFFRCFLFLFLFLFEFTSLFGQNVVSEPAGILFYNVENFFNPEHNEGKDDLEFTPDGERGWNRYRQITKENNICRVILFAGRWNPPALVGLCEVEDQEVLKSLIFNTGLHNLGYSVEHFESPDRRGVDVALLYRTSRFSVLKSTPRQVYLGPESRPTRDILHVKGILDGRDTLHVVVNHWPSRWGGEMVTRQKRMMASNVLRNLCDSILQSNPSAAIVALGDFNDEPEDESIRNLRGCLFNLAENFDGDTPGTLKYRHEWNCFDQILVSSALLPEGGAQKLVLGNKKMKIISAPFLLEEDPQFPGKRLKRTYRGYEYFGGFSDHLPVYVELVRGASL
ncbi:endonuclease/exonuclease/phosphatase family protein [Marinilabilia sp.]|uniref:endonuclease/exonuclease/phosphatase family protein n=1 Tax=Marinilabilia sp. TaxID=2021252 RepID=UPI0025BECD43|nr:endonuclease/exonuclease/phosphatase family protein [Marinilabilia sp.]